MSKEDFYRQIEVAKQQIVNEKLQAERKAAEDKRQAEENRRNEEIERQKEEIRRIKETRKNFAGTNIIETLEEIRDKQILIASENTLRVINKNFWGVDKKHYDLENDPMRIEYNLNSVSAHFDCWSSCSGGDDEHYSSGSRSITIIKKNNTMELIYDNNGQKEESFEISSSKPADIINGIAKIVAIQQTRKKYDQSDLW